jgi:RNA polymerase sigma-70 factor (ECF subfamily)
LNCAAAELQLKDVEAETGIAEQDFDAIIRQHQRRIYRILMAITRNPDTAETLTQECFLRAFQKRQSFRGESSVGTWLVRIAINLARDQARSPRAGFWKKLFSPGTGDSARMGSAHDGAPDVLSEMESLPDGRSSAEKQLLAREQVDLMWKAVAKLTQRQRAIFLLRFVEEMSLDEIANITQLRVSSVKTHLWRATAAVRQQLKQQGSAA